MPRKIDAQRLQAFREDRHWSQEGLAEAAGLNPRTVQCIERTGVATRASLAAIALALGLQPTDLLPRNEDQPAVRDSTVAIVIALVLSALAGAGAGYLHALLNGAPLGSSVWSGLVWGAPICFTLWLLLHRRARNGISSEG